MKRLALALVVFFVAIPTGSAQEQSAAQQATAKPQRIRVGGSVQQANLLHQVLPVYPLIAKTAHIEGTVVLHTIIGKDGAVQTLQFVSGPPLLMRAAMDAVRQWIYKPTLLNGEPVEVDTTIDVVFTLGTTSEDSAPAKPIDPQLREDILRLLEIMHAVEKAQDSARSAFDAMRPMLTRSLPDTPHRDKIVAAYEDKLAQLFQKPELMEGIVQIYAKYFSADDVRAMTDFYATPAGQHAIAHLDDIMADSIRLGQKLASDNLAGILAELCKEFPELEGQAKFCAASGQDTSRLRPDARSAPVPDPR
ncbi:MAG TPA: TonB family protein [Candidatus Cybelea sp.]|nr:TonB family protein [Candidatus Cybelea sp.]